LLCCYMLALGRLRHHHYPWLRSTTCNLWFPEPSKRFIHRRQQPADFELAALPQ
jgi:hypothetical protein